MKTPYWLSHLGSWIRSVTITILFASSIAWAIWSVHTHFTTPPTPANAYTLDNNQQPAQTHVTADDSKHTDITVALASFQQATTLQQHSPDLIRIAEHYKQQLANSSPFDNWKQGTLDVMPLGPGTHGWLVRVLVAGKQVGYMILSASNPSDSADSVDSTDPADTQSDTVKLTEYGTGEQTPYDLNTLKQALLFHLQTEPQAASYAHIEPYYDDTQVTLWKVINKQGVIAWLDAQSGEWLPDEYQPESKYLKQNQRDAISAPASLASHKHHTTSSAAHLVQSQPNLELRHAVTDPTPALLQPLFDPYENVTWMSLLKQVRANASSLTDEFNPLDEAHKWIYVQSSSNGSVHVQMPFSVVGLQQWGIASTSATVASHRQPTSYVAVASPDLQATRYIHIESAVMNGTFVPQK
ncbi:hypothetical protein [Paenibacillus sp. 481]|uniref:hypothetical protein n=1 Tax=Paenibacillus sp. 481 TaxID=2835869 RepID=UPI001E44ECDB|nr:hypothetical protein [Paenibacillus sp. 481]UHA72681.1 hypothetical protein KIK04_18850 [Paenibacillus sp. 481]